MRVPHLIVIVVFCLLQTPEVAHSGVPSSGSPATNIGIGASPGLECKAGLDVVSDDTGAWIVCPKGATIHVRHISFAGRVTVDRSVRIGEACTCESTSSATLDPISGGVLVSGEFDRNKPSNRGYGFGVGPAGEDAVPAVSRALVSQRFRLETVGNDLLYITTPSTSWGQGASTIERFTRTGNVASTWGVDGRISIDDAQSLLAHADSDGRVVAVYQTGRDGPHSRRFTTRGEPDQSWGSAGVVGIEVPNGSSATVTAFTISSSGTVLITGTFVYLDRGAHFVTWVRTIDAAGGKVSAAADVGGTCDCIDLAYPPSVSPEALPNRFVPLEDGRIVLIGSEGGSVWIRMYASSGELDRAFASGGTSRPSRLGRDGPSDTAVIVSNRGILQAVRMTGRPDRRAPTLSVAPATRTGSIRITIPGLTFWATPKLPVMRIAGRDGTGVVTDVITTTYAPGFEQLTGSIYSTQDKRVRLPRTKGSGPVVCIAATAVDAVGNGKFVEGTCAAQLRSIRALKTSRGWNSVLDPAAPGGVALSSNRPGRSVALPRVEGTAGRTIIVASSCPTCGSMDVLVGARVVRHINLRTSGSLERRAFALPASTVAVRYRLRTAGAGSVTLRGYLTDL